MSTALSVSNAMRAKVNMILDTGLQSSANAGIDATGASDVTSELIAFFERGGDLYVGPGNYLIAAAGDNAGGVYCTLRTSTRVVCHPQARFFTNGLDNDMIRFTVPSNGAGLPSGGVDFEWRGGLFDQSAQKVSQVVPFRANYPPSAELDGFSNVTDALSARGSYTIGGTAFHGVRRTVIEGVVTYAGDHWRIAGGDSGIFVEGAQLQIVRGCLGIGNRDLAIYASGEGDLECQTIIENNKAINCCHGFAMKRGSSGTAILGNYAENCVRCITVSTTGDVGDVGALMSVFIASNTGRRCSTFVKLDVCRGFTVADNHFFDLGAKLDDDATFVQIGSTFGYGVQIADSSFGVVRHNTVQGIAAGWAAASSTYEMLRAESGTTRVRFIENVGHGLRTAGQDSGTNNSYLRNIVYDAASSAHMTGALGPNTYEIRLDPITQAEVHTFPVQFSDGSATAPAIARRGQLVPPGLFFGTNSVALVSDGKQCLAAVLRGTNAVVNVSLQSLSGDSAAGAAGLIAGDLYRDANGTVHVKL